MAQAPLDVPGAGCATKRARGRERERVAEGARRKFIGGESRDETRSRGCSRGEGGGGWRRHERTPYSEGFQAAVYGPGQRDQDQPRAGQGEREPRLVERSERRSLGGFSGARVGDLEPRRCVPSRSATPRPRPVQSGRECLAGRASTHGDERRRSAGSCSEHVPGARKAHQATPGALIVDQSRAKRAIAGDIGPCTPGEARSRVPESRECIGGLGMTLLQARGANAARSRTVPMFAALAPLLIFVGFDGVVHGVARSGFHQDSTNTATGPIFVAPVGNQTAAIGREVVFSCSVRNISIRKYKVGWLRNSDQTILSIHTRIVTHNARISVSYESGGSSGSGGASGGTFGVTGSSQATEEVVNGTWRLHIRQLKETDRGCYMCQINTSPMISELGCLDIHVPPDIVYGDTSADLAVAEGDNATLSCRATGHPPPRVSWRREDGEPIVIRASTVGGSTFERHDHYNGSLLHFHRVERRQMGAYLCIASNDVPPAVSKRVTLAVNFAPVVKAPNQLLGAPLGTDVQLECYVEAFPNTINYWVKNQRGTEDEMLLEGPKYNVREERTGYTVLMWLLIKKFTEKDVGSYKCVSTNSLGKADGTLRLYEIKIGFDRTSRGKDHVSIIGGLAEAAQSSGASNGVEGFSGSGSSLSHILSMFFFIPILWPR